MSTTRKWTIGMPSEYGTHNANTIFGGKDNAICMVYGVPLHKTLESIETDPSAREGLANARLIASAPEMRDALRAIQKIAARVLEDAPDTIAGPIDEIRRLAEGATSK